MTSVYRILRRRYSKKPLDGEGSYLFGGRWSSVGTRLAYTAEHLSLAILEYFVHIDPDDPPKDLVRVRADVPDSVSRYSLIPERIPRDWRKTPGSPELVEIGDKFARDSRAAILIVPSVLAPSDSNWLINPLHPDSSRIRAHPAEPFEYDRRFFSSTS